MAKDWAGKEIGGSPMAQPYDEGEREGLGRGCGEGKSIAVDKPSPVSKSLDEVGAVLGLLRDTIASLERRLAPVMIPVSEPNKVDKEKEEPQRDMKSCKLATTLETFIRQINDRNADIRTLISRLEV
jgi:hypothetical protein